MMPILFEAVKLQLGVAAEVRFAGKVTEAHAVLTGLAHSRQGSPQVSLEATPKGYSVEVLATGSGVSSVDALLIASVEKNVKILPLVTIHVAWHEDGLHVDPLDCQVTTPSSMVWLPDEDEKYSCHIVGIFGLGFSDFGEMVTQRSDNSNPSIWRCTNQCRNHGEYSYSILAFKGSKFAFIDPKITNETT